MDSNVSLSHPQFSPDFKVLAITLFIQQAWMSDGMQSQNLQP